MPTCGVPIDGVAVRHALKSALEPFERSRDLLIAVDRNLAVVTRNAAGTAHLSEGLDATELFPHAHRDLLRRCVNESIETGEARWFEWGESGPGGAASWFSANVVPVNVDGEIVGAIISSHDVTSLKQSEQRLRRSEQLMVDTQGVAHLGTWEWEITQPNASWSAELYRIYGLTPEAYAPSYEAYLTMVHPDDRQRVIDATNLVFHEHVPYSHDERIFRPDGSMRYLHTWAHPVLDQAGKLLKLVGVCQDITDRMEAEETVRRLNSELEQRVVERTQLLETALRDLETFNSMVSHDLRAPLAVIQLAVDMIANQRDLPTKVLPNVDRIRRALDNMSQLVEALLTFARAGHGALQATEINASELCVELVAEQRQTSERHMEIQIEPDIRLRVDPALFRVALANLVGNAWKYTARCASPRIEIGTVRRADGHALFIRDNGIGFDMHEHDLLFRPFSRLKNATDFKGTGIGLATVERVVERHGGSIRAEGAVGSGATFFLLLPESVWV